MTTNILDAVTAKLNAAVAAANSASGKADAETNRASAVEDGLNARLTALEGEFTDARAAFQVTQDLLAAQTARVDVLIGQLVQLGVTP